MKKLTEEEKKHIGTMEDLKAYRRSRDKQDRILDQKSRQKIEIGDNITGKFDKEL